MGKRGSLFSTIKRVVVPTSKDQGTEDKSSKAKKGLGKLRHGDKHSFIPLFREPSSIEKILGDAEEDYLINFKPHAATEQATPPPPTSTGAVTSRTAAAAPPKANASPPRVAGPSSSDTTAPDAVSGTPCATAVTSREPLPPPAASPGKAPTALPGKAQTLAKVLSVSPAIPSVNAGTIHRAASTGVIHKKTAKTTLRDQHACATKIQAVYRGYLARRSSRALKGLMRLQNVMKGQSVKRQITSAMKSMHLLVRVQSQIQSRRIQMLENQDLPKCGKDLLGNNGESNMSQTDEWDDSVLTKDEVDARTQRKFEAMVKRERAAAYAYSRQSTLFQLWKATPFASRAALMDSRTGGFPWWWNWLDRRVSSVPSSMPSENISTKNIHLKPSLLPPFSNCKEPGHGISNLDSPSRQSSRSTASEGTKLNNIPPRRPFPQKLPRSRAGTADSYLFNDNDSLTSCPTFSIPRYMEPTASAKAKVRGSSRIGSLAQSIGSFKWSKEPTPIRHNGKNPWLLQSSRNLSVDSTHSMPATLGRKPFKRFV